MTIAGAPPRTIGSTIRVRATPATRRLPRFDVGEYIALLEDLRPHGWTFDLVQNMDSVAPGTVLLRHDVDLHLDGVLRIAECEASIGVASTWFVLLTGPYNVMSLRNRQVLRRLRALGHEVGLHYDMETYPLNEEAAARHLDREAQILGELAGGPVQSIVTHQPGLGGRDPLRESTRYVHPHASRRTHNLLYVSDSCRAWRDDSLLRCFRSDRPERLLLNTHPELWLDGSITNRAEYLGRVLRPNIARAQTAYIDDVVSDLWRHHPGGRAHDARESLSD